MNHPLLLLHGALANRKQLEKIQEYLSIEFDVYSINFSGHDGTKISDDFSINLFTWDVLKFIQNHHIKNFDVFGYSMGGYVALNFAKQNPGYIRKIMTLGTKFDWSPESAEKESSMLVPAIIRNKVPKYADALSALHGPDLWEEVVVKTASMMKSLGMGNALRDEDFKNIQCPVQICIGSEDKMVTLDESKKITQLLPNATLNIIAGWKHPLESADPQMLSAIISDFITTNP